MVLRCLGRNIRFSPGTHPVSYNLSPRSLSGLRRRHPVLSVNWAFKLLSTTHPSPPLCLCSLCSLCLEYPLFLHIYTPAALAGPAAPSPSFHFPVCLESTRYFPDCRALMPGSLPLQDFSPVRSGSSSNPSKRSTCYTSPSLADTFPPSELSSDVTPS